MTASLLRAVQASHLLMTDMGRVLLTGIKHCVSLPPTAPSHVYPQGVEQRLPWAAPELLQQVRAENQSILKIFNVLAIAMIRSNLTHNFTY